jgi:uncharacterized membrane protein
MRAQRMGSTSQYWTENVNAASAEAARNAAMAYDGTQYDWRTNNCSMMVAAAMAAAELVFDNRPSRPKTFFRINIRHAQGHGNL